MFGPGCRRTEGFASICFWLPEVRCLASPTFADRVVPRALLRCLDMDSTHLESMCSAATGPAGRSSYTGSVTFSECSGQEDTESTATPGSLRLEKVEKSRAGARILILALSPQLPSRDDAFSELQDSAARPVEDAPVVAALRPGTRFVSVGPRSSVFSPANRSAELNYHIMLNVARWAC